MLNKSMAKNSAFFILISFSIILISLSKISAQSDYLQGYSSTVSGTNFSYHSPLPDVNNSLLIRASKDYEPIVWMTERVPSNYNKEKVSFIWLYAIDVTSNSEEFDLYVNDQKYFTFTNPLDNSEETWKYEKQNGASLVFNRTMVDKHKDNMGFAIITLPTKELKLGQEVKIGIDGADRKSSSWFMTFKTGLKEKIDILQQKVVMKKGDELFHSARFSIIYLGEPVEAIINVDEISERAWLKSGYNSIDLLFPKVEKKTEFIAEVKIGNREKTKIKFILEPVKEWTVYLVQHSHTDIGYTRPQTEILSEHLRYIDDALDYCDKTDNYPDNAKFRWTCEASWAVREYFKSRPKSQIDRLLERIKEGRIEVTGMFFNFSEIVDETALAMQSKTLKEFKDRGIDVKTAMQNDVNGIGWCIIDYYKNTDVKYVTMGQHGHRAHVPFNKPTAFWWESPSGNKLLAYRSEHYMHGNALALTSGYMDVFASNLAKYLDKLENKGYPHSRTAIQFSGYVTDNSPPSTTACEIVKEWNEKIEWPKLKLALAGEFMNFLDENSSNTLPVKNVSWPDWWADGFGSAMIETKAARNTHSEMIANMGLISMAKVLGAELPDGINEEITGCYDNLLFYDEHTFGAAESISDPLSENSVVQWGEKAAYVWTAVKESSLLKEKAMGFLHPFIPKSSSPTVTIYNTLNWERSGLVKVYIDHDILPLNKKFKIYDEKKNVIPAQVISSRSDGSYWALWVSEIPAFGYKTINIVVADELQSRTVASKKESILENEFYKISLNSDAGVIDQIFDKKMNTNLMDPKSDLRLGEVIYEQIENRHSMERLTNDNRDTVYVPLKKTITKLVDIKTFEIEEGPIWQSLKLHGSLPVCADNRGVDVEIKLYNYEKKIELIYSMHKLPNYDPEAVYVSFPFKIEGSENKIEYDVQGGIVTPGVNQLEGTSSDWNAVQNFVSVKNDKAQIVLNTDDILLAQFGDINTGRFYYTNKPKNPHIYSWVLNNYWTTNFKASQEGEMKWKYNITSTDNNSISFATRFGWENRIPLLARVLPAGISNDNINSKSILNFNVPNLLLVNVKPSINGESIILHLRETEGDHAILDISKMKSETGAKSISEVTVLEEEIKELSSPLLFEHFETKFIRIKM